MHAYARVACNTVPAQGIQMKCVVHVSSVNKLKTQFERGAWVMLYSSNQKALESLPARTTQKPYTVVYPSAVIKY